MRPIVPISLIGLALCFAGTGLQAASLVNDSPFIPEGWLEAQNRREAARERPPAPKPQAPSIALERLLEFRGAFKLGNTWRFNIVNKKDNKSEWYTLNDRSKDIQVRYYNDQDKSIKVNFEGRTETLSLASANTQVQQVASAANVVQPTNILANAEQRIRNSNASDEKKEQMIAQLRAAQARNAGQMTNVVANSNPSTSTNAPATGINVVSGGGNPSNIPTPTISINGTNINPGTTNSGNPNNTAPAARVQRRRIIRTDNINATTSTPVAPPTLPGTSNESN